MKISSQKKGMLTIRFIVGRNFIERIDVTQTLLIKSILKSNWEFVSSSDLKHQSRSQTLIYNKFGNNYWNGRLAKR